MASKPKTEFKKPSAKEAAAIRRQAKQVLRYLSHENVLKDFKLKGERRAIAATLEWFSLNFMCAWKCKDGRYSTIARSPGVRREFGTSDSLVMEMKTYDKFIEAMKLRTPRRGAGNL